MLEDYNQASRRPLIQNPPQDIFTLRTATKPPAFLGNEEWGCILSVIRYLHSPSFSTIIGDNISRCTTLPTAPPLGF
jgi:hypothetical protein